MFRFIISILLVFLSATPAAANFVDFDAEAFAKKFDDQGAVSWENAFFLESCYLYGSEIDAAGGVTLILLNDYITYAGDNKLVRFSPTGQVLWNVNLGGRTWEMWELSLDGLGNAFVTGYAPDHPFLLRKVGPDGDLLWQTDYPLTGYSGSQTNQVLADGQDGVYLVGSVRSEGHAKAALMKYHNEGIPQWLQASEVRGWKSSHGTRLLLDGENNPILIGEVYNSGFEHRLLLEKFSPTGERLWRAVEGYDYCRTVGDHTCYLAAVDAVLDSRENIIVVGYTAISLHDYRTVTLKFDAQGDLLWQVFSDLSDEERPSAVAVDDQDNVLLASYRSGENSYLSKYSSDGEVLWTLSSATENSTRFCDVIAGEAGRVVVTGRECATDCSAILNTYTSAGAPLQSYSWAPTGNYDKSSGYRLGRLADDSFVMVGHAYEYQVQELVLDSLESGTTAPDEPVNEIDFLLDDDDLGNYGCGN